MIKLIAQQDYQNKLWKNGRGTTKEIAVSHSGLDYDWRMSMADIVESGPFSTFPGMERILVLLTGPEVKITHHDLGKREVLQPLSVYQFSGDWKTEASVSGAGRDFNLIYRRDKFEGSIKLMHLSEGQSKVFQTKKIAAMFCLQGKIKTKLGELGPYDSLLVEDDSCLFSVQEETNYLLIQLNNI